MKLFKSILFTASIILVFNPAVFAQAAKDKVVITGVRFAYPLVEKWIRDYSASNPNVEIVIDSRTITDPEKYDLLIEAYEHEKEVKATREYVSIARYALIPVANSTSQFAKEYGDKGLNEKLIKQIFFHDIYAEKNKDVTVPFTIYTRIQKAGAPLTFAKYFGYEQQNIKGKAIAGADEHLIKALLKDETGITYTTPGLAFDLASRKPVTGITIIPVDLDGNGRVAKDEKLTENLDLLVTALETQKVKNVPVEYLHFSIGKQSTNQEAKKFLLWVADHAEADLHQYGYLKPEEKKLQSEKEKLERFSALK